MNLSLKLKPSLLGRYFECKCDRFLVHSAMDKSVQQQLGLPQSRDYEDSAAALAGRKWEEILFDRLKKDDSYEVIDLTNETAFPDEKYKSTIEAIKGISNRKKTIYLYQACLRASKSFKKEHLASFMSSELNPYLSSQMYPDFIRAEYDTSKKKFKLTVIDAKNASMLKKGAEIQIAVYVKLLESIIVDEKIGNCYIDTEEGIVWNREKRTDVCLEHVFNLQHALDEVEAFFSDKLHSIGEVITSAESDEQIPKSLDYNLNQQCEYCDNFEWCKKTCAENLSVRLLPYVRTRAQKRVSELIENGELADDSFASVKELLETNPESLTDGCADWRRVANNLEAYEKGILSYVKEKNERFPRDASSISFPVRQNFSLLLSAQQDVNKGRVYAFSWLLVPGNGIDIWNMLRGKMKTVEIYETKWESPGKGKYFDSVIAHDDTKEEFNRVDRVFVESLYELLRRISDYKDPEKRKLQCFVMDDYERNNLEDTLYSMLEYLDPDEDRDLLEKVMTILFWFQGERTVTELEKQPAGEVVENPVTVLTTEISRLYVLSECISYNLKTIAKVFSPALFFDEDDEEFFGVLTNVVNGMPIIRAWKETDDNEKERKLENIAYHIRKRLFIEYEIIKTMQRDNDEDLIHLSTWPMKYQMVPPKYPDYPEIARLDFENRYEELLKYQEIRKVRINGIQNAIDSGMILQLAYSGSGDTFDVLNYEHYIGREWHSAFLCEDTPENRLQIMLLRDKPYTKNVRPYYVVDETDTVFYSKEMEMEYNYRDEGCGATMEFKAAKGSKFEPVEGLCYLFFEVYSDWNSGRTAAGLKKLVNRPEFLDPALLSTDTGLVFDDKARNECSKYWSPDKNKFSTSQEEAFKHFFEQRLSILVGPPASGKTDFIARSLITLSSYYQKVEKKNLKIMVTAMSNSAIENVLLKLDKMLRKENKCGIKLYKSNKFDDKATFAEKNVDLIEDYHVTDEMNSDEIQIIGMTCWSAFKEFHHEKKGKMREFDVIVMDEASQVRAMDAFLTLECSNQNTRFLLVGDDDQLPPIIAGKYKEKEGEKYIHGSIFHMYLTALSEDYPDIIRLSDNFRMNGILCKYSADKIYGPQYKAFNEEIKKQRITMANKPGNPLLVSILDEDYPLVFCELSGPARSQREAEVSLVADVVYELQKNLINDSTGNLAQVDGNFWRENDFLDGACGIISPHHEHINRLKTRLSEDLGCDRNDVYIGTVDKLQGKERKAVIVSYGVCEAEKIRNESEFIYSRNRFNVSITRGKAKTIVFLSEAIAEASIDSNILVNNTPSLRKGMDFIHGFMPFMESDQDGEGLVSEVYPDYAEDVCIKLWKKKLNE